MRTIPAGSRRSGSGSRQVSHKIKMEGGVMLLNGRLKGLHRYVTVAALFAASLATISGPAGAVDFNIPVPGSDNGIHGQLNTTATAGVGFRTQSQSDNLVGKIADGA